MDRETLLRKLTELKNEVFERMCSLENDWLEQEAEYFKDLYNEMVWMDFDYTSEEEYDDLVWRFENSN